MLRARCALALRRQTLTSHVLRTRLAVNIPSSSVNRQMAAAHTSGLRHSSSTDASSAVPVTLKTLNPSKMTREEYVDWSGREKSTLQFPFAKPSASNEKLVQTWVSTRYEDTEDSVFPPHAKGFLYAYKPEDVDSVLAYELRLRVTSSEDPAEFDDGEDLLDPNGQPWSVHFLRLLGKADESSLKSVLVADEFMTVHQVRKLSDAAAELSASHAPVVHALGHSFEIDLNKPAVKLFIVGKNDLWEAPLNVTTLENPKDKKDKLFTGRIKVAFEQSFRPEHAGTRTIVLRVKEILEPVELISTSVHKDSVSFPEVGELLGGRSDKPWSCDVDKVNTGFAQASRFLLVGKSASPAVKAEDTTTSSTRSRSSKLQTEDDSAISNTDHGSIATLAPIRLEPSDFMDWSGESDPSFKIIRPPGTPKTLVEPKFTVKTPEGFVFPEGSHGFLYLHQPESSESPFARSVRMRLTEDDNPDGFDNGTDLLGPGGFPWSMNVMKLFGTKPGDSVAKRVLSQDKRLGKVDVDMMSRAACSSQTPIITALGEPFPLVLDRSQTTVRMIESKVLVPTKLPNPTQPYPFKGVVHVALEISGREEHESKRVLVLRVIHVEDNVLEADEDAEEHNVPAPAAGELLQWTEEDVWALDVDQNRSKFAVYARKLFGNAKTKSKAHTSKPKPAPKKAAVPMAKEDVKASLDDGFKTELSKIRKSLALLEKKHFDEVDDIGKDMAKLMDALRKNSQIEAIFAKQQQRRAR